jgi:formate-dependent nitrite reductase membrane component NrfD
VTQGDGPTTSYYDRPVVKEPVWIWAVPAYFFVGGAAGAAAALGAAAQSLDGNRLRGLVVRCRRLAAAGTALGTCLLIYDLGRPERFLNMLRVFRPTSPMSIGSWLLAAVTGSSSASVVLSEIRAVRALGEMAGLGAGLLGVPLTGYTGVLLSDTAVPLWQSTRGSLPALFVASGTSGAASLLFFTDLTEDEEKVVQRVDIVAGVAELIAAWKVERDAARVERVAVPLNEGVGGKLWKTSTALGASSLLLSIMPGRSRTRTVASALLGVAGGVAIRFALFYAGKASARDPEATFELQRAGS